MDYSYNYGFLREFKESHRLSKKDLLEALGSSDYTGINRWLDGKTPIHVTAMLRFCNYYNIPISGFFFDADGESDLHIMPPTEGCQTMPTDGYGMGGGAGKSIIATHVGERSISSQAQAKAVSEGLARKNAQKEVTTDLVPMGVEEDPRSSSAEQDYVAPQPIAESASITESEAMLRLKLDHANELRQIEREHRDKEDQIRRDCQTNFDAERNRLMDIIERQNAELSKFYSRSHQRQNGWDTPLMAAEDRHED